MKQSPLRWAMGFTLICGIALVAMAIGVAAWAEHEGLATISARLVLAAPWLLMWRLVLFSLLMLYWCELSGEICRVCRFDRDTRAALRQWRWRAGVGLVAMDLVLVEDLIGHTLRWLG
jgi:hypothetical protein